MNIFVLDTNPAKAAKYHNDKHCVKMIIETAQLLSTAHRIIDGTQEEVYFKTVTRVPINDDPDCKETIPVVKLRKRKHYTLGTDEFIYRFGLKIFKQSLFYKATHISHPCAIWVRESKSNYEWAYRLFVELSHEYTSRYGRTHKTFAEKAILLGNTPNIPNKGLTEFPQCMPEDCGVKDNPVKAYRNYYRKHKKDIAQWMTEIPFWWNEDKNESYSNI